MESELKAFAGPARIIGCLNKFVGFGPAWRLFLDDKS
jgi:hypothetical protein